MGRPGTIPAGTVSRVTFASASDGWVYGPGLWATHDGGASWHRVATHGAEVNSLAVTGRHVLAVFVSCARRCPGSWPVRFGVYRASTGGDSWRLVSGTSGKGYAQLVIAGPHAFVLQARLRSGGGSLLVGPVGGPGRWRRSPLPCPRLVPAAIAGTAAGLVLACEQAPGRHPVLVQLYRSSDGGAHWHHIAARYLEDGIGSLSVTPSGTIAMAAMYTGLMISRDGGRTWQLPRSVDRSATVAGGTTVQAVMATDRLGLFIAQRYAAWITSDGGRTWTRLSLS